MLAFCHVCEHSYDTLPLRDTTFDGQFVYRSSVCLSVRLSWSSKIVLHDRGPPVACHRSLKLMTAMARDQCSHCTSIHFLLSSVLLFFGQHLLISQAISISCCIALVNCIRLPLIAIWLQMKPLSLLPFSLVQGQMNVSLV